MYIIIVLPIPTLPTQFYLETPPIKASQKAWIEKPKLSLQSLDSYPKADLLTPASFLGSLLSSHTPWHTRACKDILVMQLIRRQNVTHSRAYLHVNFCCRIFFICMLLLIISTNFIESRPSRNWPAIPSNATRQNPTSCCSTIASFVSRRAERSSYFCLVVCVTSCFHLPMRNLTGDIFNIHIEPFAQGSFGKIYKATLNDYGVVVSGFVYIFDIIPAHT